MQKKFSLSRGRVLIIRDMVADDVPEVARQEQAIFPSPWSEKSFLSILHEQSVSLCLVGTINGNIAAYAMSWTVAPELYIANFAVVAAYRKQKLGSYMLQTLLERGARRGCTSALLEVRAHNTHAISLYEKFGFEVVGVREKYYENGEDALLMNLHY